MNGNRAQTATVLALLAVLLCAQACSKGPDEEALRQEVQQKLNGSFKAGLFEVSALKRQGSAQLPASEQGGSRLIVYYNLTLKLLEGYDFNGWEALSPATLANLLGASEKGVIGVKPQQTRPGDAIRVYASSTYERSGDAWMPVAFTPQTTANVPPVDPGDAAPPSQSRRFLNQLAAMVDIPPPGVPTDEDRIIAEELERAVAEIARRREREQHDFVVASGPGGGEYARVAEAIVTAVRGRRAGINLRTFETAGSVENVQRLARGEADYALVQSNIAAMAVQGLGPFAPVGGTATLAAVGSLFPEPVHVVVSAKSAIRRVADLKGKRVNVGRPSSGSRIDAVAVLQASQIAFTDLAETSERDLDDAVRLLRAGRLDAVITTGAAPIRDLQQLAGERDLRFLSLDEDVIGRLVSENPGLVRLTVPANTYPRQTEAVVTVAPTALLVGTASAPQGEVEALVRLFYEDIDFAASGSTQGAKISKSTALRGVSIPLHPGAAKYLGKAEK
jgi:TRAP transporter TAXI family solute receptor